MWGKGALLVSVLTIPMTASLVQATPLGSAPPQPRTTRLFFSDTPGGSPRKVQRQPGSLCILGCKVYPRDSCVSSMAPTEVPEMDWPWPAVQGSGGPGLSSARVCVPPPIRAGLAGAQALKGHSGGTVQLPAPGSPHRDREQKACFPLGCPGDAWVDRDAGQGNSPSGGGAARRLGAGAQSTGRGRSFPARGRGCRSPARSGGTDPRLGAAAKPSGAGL